jgi:flagellar biosynthesis/type III secretory pathway chaperone
MAGMINQLLDTMNEQAERYGELLGLSVEKREAVVKNDIEHLQKITNLENIIVSQNQKLERKRLEIVKDIAEVLNKKGEELTLAALVDLLKDQNEKNALVEVGSRIRDIMNELSEINALNASLIQNALEYIDYSLNVMKTSINQNPATYSVKGGQLQEDESLFDARH